ncbi:sodium:alanine symporter family protein [uncultured Corynebacterium sp.]|uniref:alanine/glycine:cation symporter family protein n=1 Tax=uncultured Corynebacterium sp. TaxID=159447 RepID=UPI0025FD4A0E|nr:alanine/glycine:cation symporter family protein [uncultured Corynebacterium sp.]
MQDVSFADSLQNHLDKIDQFIWSQWLLIPLLLLTGLWLTFRLRGVQFRKLGVALRHGLIDRDDDGGEGDITQYQALTTALAATVGVGNIVGVATAISIGGPGALFWMWITGLVGMASKYSEAFLGVRFRVADSQGNVSGGPQRYLSGGIPGRLGQFLAWFFTIAAIIASFGIGNLTQGNAVAAGLEDTFGTSPTITGAVMFVLVGAVLLGGIGSIGKVTSAFVPLMILIYIVGGFVVLGLHIGEVPESFGLIFSDAFTGTSATGGFVGSGIMLAMQMGVARGIFSNESGMGSAAIAAAAAKTTHPVRQGLVSMTQTFIDTIIVVTMTGLVIITTGVWNTGEDNAANMTAQAFSKGLGSEWGGTIVSLSIVFFAFSTILGWSYYGERNAERALGPWASLPYRMVFTCVVFVGATTEIGLAWTFADIANGLMALPNLVGLLILSGLVARETKAYLDFDPTLRARPEDVERFLVNTKNPWRSAL